MIQDELKKIGLKDNETQIYLYLLENGVSTPPQIAKGTGIARTNCYHILRSLKEQFLIEERRTRKRKTYHPRDPEAFLLGLQEKREFIEQIIPDLRALHAKSSNKPNIRFYEGLDEVKQIYRETLSAEKVSAVGSISQLSRVDEKFCAWYTDQFRKRHIIFDDILTHASRTKVPSDGKESLYRPRFLPERYSDLPTDVLVWGDNIALIILQEPIFGTVITNANLGRTFRIFFDFMWNAIGDRR